MIGVFLRPTSWSWFCLLPQSCDSRTFSDWTLAAWFLVERCGLAFMIDWWSRRAFFPNLLRWIANLRSCLARKRGAAHVGFKALLCNRLNASDYTSRISENCCVIVGSTKTLRIQSSISVISSRTCTMLACLGIILRLTTSVSSLRSTTCQAFRTTGEIASTSTSSSSALSSTSWWATWTSANCIIILWRHPFTLSVRSLWWTLVGCLAVKECSFITNSHIFQAVMKVFNSFFITCIETVSSIHLELPLSHKFRFFDLALWQLDLGSVLVVHIRIVLVIHIVILATTLSLLILDISLWLRLLLISSVLLSYLVFHLIDRILF